VLAACVNQNIIENPKMKPDVRDSRGFGKQENRIIYEDLPGILWNKGKTL